VLSLECLVLECLVHQFIEQAGFERPADREAVAGANVGGWSARRLWSRWERCPNVGRAI
jgi:hypothetical protein